MTDLGDSRQYLDCCDKCTPRRRVVVAPIQVRPSDIGSGEVADYLCPFGHTWFTSWNHGGDTNYLAA